MLKDVRMKAGMRQKDVAEALGIKQTTYSAWETGRVSIPAHHLDKLADLFDVPAEEITAPPDNNSLKAWEKKLLETIREQPPSMDYLLATTLTTFIGKSSFIESGKGRDEYLRAFLQLLVYCNNYADAHLFYSGVGEGLAKKMIEPAETLLNASVENFKLTCQNLERKIFDEDVDSDDVEVKDE